MANDLLDTVRPLGLQVREFDYSLYCDNVGIEWQKWLRSFETMIRASRIFDENWKQDLLLHYAGSKVQMLIATLPDCSLSELVRPLANVEQYVPHMNEYERTVAKLNTFFQPKANTTYERHILRQMKQKSDENIDMFTIRLRMQAERCGFEGNLEENVKDQIIQNCRSAVLRRDLLKRGDTSLGEILRVAKVFETVAQQEKLFDTDKPQPQIEDVNKINFNSWKTKQPYPQSHDSKKIECNRCGFHGHFGNDGKCPARGKLCNKCGRRDHFARVCRSRKRTREFEGHDTSVNKISKIEETLDYSNKEQNDESVKHITVEKGEYVFNVSTKDDGCEVKCRIGGVMVNAVIDSGSKYNLLSQQLWEFLKSNKIIVTNQRKETGKIFRSYGGHELPLIGAFTAEFELSGKCNSDFYVIRGEGKLLIGRDTATKLDILKINTVNKIDEEKTEPLGKIKGVLIDIPIKKDVLPIIQSYRRIPVALEKAVDTKIDELLSQDIIEKVNKPAKWISPVVVVPKGNDIRLCIDMRRANEAIERENYPLPTIEDFLPHLGNGKVFSKLDVKNAFHQIEISESSREITTFITRRGLFRYKRLMFGIVCAPELFQKTMEQILSACDGCVVFIDDILVYGADKKEHDPRLTLVQETLEKHCVTLNQGKCIFGVEELNFLGHRLTKTGIFPDSDKLESIRLLREPRNAEEVRSFLGLVNYVGKFIPNLATITDPLRFLTKKGQKFVWEINQQNSFDRLKECMSNQLTLGYYDINDRTQLIADASPVGLGAVLIQINESGPRIISYASKSLSDTEKRYAQTEKEALALVWAAERFHFYLFGREFELITDHKPLEVIFGTKSRPCARIERWVLRLMSYKYKVIYRPGKSNIADPLSRLAISEDHNIQSFDEQAEQYVNWVTSNATPVAIKLLEIEQKSINDDAIQAVKVALRENIWTGKALEFKIFASEFCFSGEILLRGTRIVMPEVLRCQTLDLAHEGHPGITLMKQRLHSKVWWPKMDADVEKRVKQCRGCIMVSAPSAPEPITRKQLPSEPWQHLAIDFLGPLPSQHHLFVIVDYYSRYTEIEIMKTINSTETIKRLQTIFARFGLPLSITADNGRQFTSDEFRDFCNSNNIQLINTIPYWPQQNGEVERQNRSIIKRLIISQNTGRNWITDLNEYLLMYRSTPHSTTQKTPSQMLFGRNIRDKLPSIYQPMEIDEETADKDKEKKERGKVYADKRRQAKESNIEEGNEVLIKRMMKTNKLASNFEPEPHKVISKKAGEVVVMSKETGRRYRRNISHLKKLRSGAESIVKSTNIADTKSNIYSSNQRIAETPNLRRSSRRSEFKNDLLQN